MGKRVVKKRTTKKQVKANRANATKSTGPRTVEGKARVRLNAIKHGLRAEQVVVLGGPTAEEPAEFDSLLNGMLHDCKPEGALERVLVERLAVSYWRLRRAYRFEARAIERANEPNPMSKMLEELSQLPPHEPGLQELPGLRSLDKLVRYELMIDRELLRTAVQLERLQHTRKLEERRADACDAGPATNTGRDATGQGATAVSAVRPAGQPQGLQPTRAEGRATGRQAASGTPVGIVPDPAKAQWPNKPISQPSASGRTTSVQIAIRSRVTAQPIRRGGAHESVVDEDGARLNPDDDPRGLKPAALWAWSAAEARL